MDYKDKVFLIVICILAFLLWGSWQGGYESALSDVRNGNVKVSCEVCPRGY